MDFSVVVDVILTGYMGSFKFRLVDSDVGKSYSDDFIHWHQ